MAGIKAGPSLPEIPTIPTGPVKMSHATEKLITCPYNQAHSILQYRMQVHLHKCRKQYPSEDWGYCAHNSTHHMPRQELQWHEDHQCPDRHSYQAQIVSFGESKSLIPIDHIDLPEPEENWDDGPVNVFNPQENAKAKALIRGIHCVPPLERKQFREEHRRHVESSDDIVTKSKLNSHNSQKKPSATKEEGIMEPLRAPKQLPKGFTMGRGIRPVSSESPAMQATSSSTAQPATRPNSAFSTTWIGMGRGKPISPPESSAPPQGAWGNGRPKF